MQIFVSGSLAYDRIMDFPGRFSDHILPDKIHMLNVCFLVNGLEEKFGGTAGNIAYSLALLGERPLILAAAGRDFDPYEKWLRRLGLPLEGIVRVATELTACAYITTDLADNQITGFNPGAMKCATSYDLDGVDPQQSLAIVAPGNLEDMRRYPEVYRQRRVPFIVDPGQNIPAFSRSELLEMLEGSMMLISNDYELELIMRATKLKPRELLGLTGTIVTTLGERGSSIQVDGDAIEVAVATPRQVTDPTGAGDAYRAGLLKGLASGADLVTAARMGAVCASYAVEKRGTQAHHFTVEEFWQRYRENFGEPPGHFGQ